MSAVTKIGKPAIKIVNGLINLLMLVVVVMLLSFSCFAIWDSSQMYSAASAANYEMYKPTTEGDAASFADLRAINPDVFAWLTVYGTNIDYPVVHGENNIKYINTDAKGNHAASGAIFLDYRSAPNFSDFSNILYGHHMENRVMFGEIALFMEKSYFEARRYGTLYIDAQEYGLEFFAFVHTDAYDFDVFRVGIKEQEDKEAYLELLMKTAMHSREDMTASADDRIVLLSTCSPTSGNGRDILISKITDTVPHDPFKAESDNKPERIIPRIDGLSDLRSEIPQWMKIGMAATALLLIALPVILIYKKRKRR